MRPAFCYYVTSFLCDFECTISCFGAELTSQYDEEDDQGQTHH